MYEDEGKWECVVPGLLVLAIILAFIFTTVANAHDFYTELTQPDNGGSCCNSSATSVHGDCGPTTARFLNGEWQALHEGAWMSIPPGKILKKESPDGKAHLCAAKGAVSPYCFIVPGAEG